MNNVEKLEKLNYLDDVRFRQGADSENDTTHDEQINAMTNTELVEQYCAWHLGDGGWWLNMKSLFDRLEQLDKDA